MDLATLLHGGASTRRAYTETYAKRSLQAPLSPPMEDQPKCSLPSISTLLEGADGAQHSAKRQRLSPPAHQREARYDTVCMPPTPPLRPGSGSGHSSIAHSPVDLNTPKHTSPHQHPHRSSISSTASSTAPQPHHAHRTSIPYASPAPSISSSASSTTAYTSPVETNSSTTLYYSHSRPQTTAINTTTSATSSTTTLNQQSPSSSSPTLISPVTPAWPHQHQHHHYFPPSSAAPYQQNPDRYICRTCHKAFSRPSSLRIHSHSHTGEKPFHCTHPGCGKAFSVRSNMKRHERGCHSGRPAVPAPQLVS